MQLTSISLKKKTNKKGKSNGIEHQTIGDRVLVEAIEETEVVKGGIYIPDSAKEKPQQAKVVAVGPGKLDDNGKLQKPEVEVGDNVLTSKYGGTDIKLDDKEYKILNSSDILAKVC